MFDPLCVSHFWSGDYILVSGSNKKTFLYTKEGIFIGCIAEQTSWIWTSKASPDGSQVVRLTDGHWTPLTMLILTNSNCGG